MEGADGISGQIDFDGKHEVGDEQAKRDVRAHITAEPETADQEKRTDGIGNVIDIKSVTRAEAVTDAGQGAIQAIAEPVDGERQDYPDERAAVPSGRPIAETRYEHGDETEKREMVGVDPPRHTLCQPDQRLLLDGGEHAELFALDRKSTRLNSSHANISY